MDFNKYIGEQRTLLADALSGLGGGGGTSHPPRTWRPLSQSRTSLKWPPRTSTCTLGGNPYFPPEVVVKDELVEEVLVKEEFAEAGRGVGLLLPGTTLRWIRRWPTPTSCALRLSSDASSPAMSVESGST